MSKKHKVDTVILAFRITGCVSISAFSSLAGIPVGITSSAMGSKFIR